MVFGGGYLEIHPTYSECMYVYQDPVLDTNEVDVAHGKAEIRKRVRELSNLLRTALQYPSLIGLNGQKIRSSRQRRVW